MKARRKLRKRMKHIHSTKFFRQHSFEILEYRRVLDTSAVGVFIRQDGTPFPGGTDLVVESYADTVAWDNADATADNYDEGSLGNDILAYRGGAANATVSNAKAGASVQSLAQILTPILSATTAPTVTQVSAQSSVATTTPSESPAEAVATTHSRTELVGDFVYDDTHPELGPKLFYGAMYFVVAGIDTAVAAIPGAAVYDGRADLGIEIRLNGNVIADVEIEGGSSGGNNSSYTGEWQLNGYVPDGEGGTYTVASQGDGINVYINFVIPINNGDNITFDSYYDDNDHTNFGIETSKEVRAHSTEYGPSIASSVFGQAINAYGYAFPASTVLPPDLQNPPLIQLPFPIDLNGDTVAGQDDIAELAHNLTSMAQSDESVIGKWIEHVAQWSRGETIVVTTEVDENDGNYELSDISLREALFLATHTTRPGHDRIVFAPWIHDILLNGTQLVIDSGVSIEGPGADVLAIDGQGLSRVFFVSANGTPDIYMSGLMITGGALVGDGAGIYNYAEKLTISDSAIVDNHASGPSGLGGGVYSYLAPLTIVDSTFDGNSATRGAAIRTQYMSTLNISGSTFSNNTASAIEGALSTYETTGIITNSTFSANSAPSAGAIRTNGTGHLDILSSTISFNEAAYAGAGIQITGSTSVELHNSILAKNVLNGATNNDVAGMLHTASSYNIIGSGANAQAFDNTTNKLGSPTAPLDPLLAPLGDYGGKTKTHALKVGSIALDGGDDARSAEYDQRGEERPISSAEQSDIGAFEAGDFTTLTVSNIADRLSSDLDPADLTLREALALSSTLQGSETIGFRPTLEGSTITLNGALNELSVTSNVHITGLGRHKLTIDADGTSRVFR